ncbi:MAG: hypothetical protein LBG49_00305 [Mycoplasmataceae bacterium]|jgi:hypothetical protein|nr:hypothetical protein [Mycoplasmataceae bacterium]
MQEINEIKLIKMYRKDPCEYIKEKIANIYMDKIYAYAKCIVRRIFTHCVDYEDECYSICYLSLDQVLQQYRITNSKYTFIQALYVVVYSRIVNHFRSISRPQVFYQSFTVRDDNAACVSEINSLDNRLRERLDAQTISDHVLTYFNKASRLIQRVLYYRSRGYKNHQISKIMRLDAKRVGTVYHHVMHKYVSENRMFLKKTNYFDSCSL